MSLATDVQQLLTDRGHPAPWRVYVTDHRDGVSGIWLVDSAGVVVAAIPGLDLAMAIAYAVNVATGTQATAPLSPIQHADPTVPDPRD